MKIKVEQCFGDKLYFELKLQNGDKYRVEGDTWTRKVAAKARDLICSLYKVERDHIYFEHK